MIPNLNQMINENNLKIVKLETELSESSTPKRRTRSQSSSAASSSTVSE